VKRVLVVNPVLQPPGGGESVAAFAVQALRERYHVCVLALETPDVDALNSHYGTDLGSRDFTYLDPGRLGRSARRLPFRLSLVRIAYLQAAARRAIARLEPAVVIGFYGEMDVGIRAIQYVHFPTLFEPRPDLERWYHLKPLVWLYRRAVLSPQSLDRVRQNYTLVNSRFVAERYAEVHGIEPAVLHPPVPHVEAPQPWEAREDVFVCAGRISREKRIGAVVEILAEVRRRGYDVALRVVGPVTQPDYARGLEPLLARHREWVHVEGSLPKPEYARVLSGARYGLHGMHEEHFGIAVAEMQQAGCVVFAPDSGGPAEILGGDSRLLATSDADAVEKIVRVLDDAALQKDLHGEALARGARYGTERFTQEFLAHVEAFEEESPRPR
jgi:glycosyltransferase involved in cell wall biosynthesis